MKNLGWFEPLFLVFPGVLAFSFLNEGSVLAEHDMNRVLSDYADDGSTSKEVLRKDDGMWIDQLEPGLTVLYRPGYFHLWKHVAPSDNVDITLTPTSINYRELVWRPTDGDIQEQVVFQLYTDLKDADRNEANLTWRQVDHAHSSLSSRIERVLYRNQQAVGLSNHDPNGYIWIMTLQFLNDSVYKLSRGVLEQVGVTLPLTRPLSPEEVGKLKELYDPAPKELVVNAISVNLCRTLRILWQTQQDMRSLPKRAYTHVRRLLGYFPEELQASTNGEQLELVLESWDYPEVFIEEAWGVLEEYHTQASKVTERLNELYRMVADSPATRFALLSK